jgi:hypothetical protein
MFGSKMKNEEYSMREQIIKLVDTKKMEWWCKKQPLQNEISKGK